MLAFAALLLLGTFYYPIGGFHQDQRAFQVVLALAGALTLACAAVFWRSAPAPQDRRRAAWLAALQLPLVALAYLFHRKIAHDHGLDPTWWPEALAMAAALLAWAWGARRGRGDAAAAGAGVLAGLCLQAGAIVATRVDGFSNTLPAVEAGCRALLAGHSPYGMLQVGPLIFREPYLPGLWLPYLPAAALGLDLRWLNLAFLTLFAAAFYHLSPPARKGAAAALLTLFFANPWLALRHDIYVPVWLLPVALAWWAQRRAKPAWEGLAWGWAAATSQLFWPLGPAVAVAAWRRYPPRGRRAWLASSLGVMVLLILPFALVDAAGMWFSGYAIWQQRGADDMSHFGLYYWLSDRRLMTLLQLAVAAVAAWQARRAGAWQPWAVLAAACGALLLTLNHLNHYYFFLPAAFLMIAWIQHEP